MNKFSVITICAFLLVVAQHQSGAKCAASEGVDSVERAVQSAHAAPDAQQEESYQRVYEAFTRLMQNMSNNSLGNVRRLVSRLNQLVGPSSGSSTPAGTPAAAQTGSGVASQQQQQQQQQQLKLAETKLTREPSLDDRTEQILNELDKVNKNTDQNTVRQLNDDVSRLIGTLNDSYLRNIRRVIERVNKVVGQPEATPQSGAVQHQSGDRLGDPNEKLPGFPGWDELIVAVDRMQKSLAHFVRSSTRLITSG